MVTLHLTHQPTIWPYNYNIHQRNIQFYQFSIIIRNGSNTIFLLIYSTAQRENAKSASFQGLSQRGINKKSVCIRGWSAKQHGHDGQNTMSSRGHHGL